MIFISVDLPAPFSPRTAWMSPAATRSDTPSFAFTAGYDLLMSTSSRRSIRRDSGGGAAIVVATAGDERAEQVAFIGERHPGEQPLMQCARHGGAARRDRSCRRIPDADVRDPARLEAADLVVEAERDRGAARRRVERLPRREALAGEGLDLVGVGHVAQHRQAGAAADVARQADADAGLARRVPAEQAAA